MRNYCLDCTIKHLGQAYVLHGEVTQGYPQHILGVIGHLAEAAEECAGASAELSKKIRQYRLLILESIIPIMDEGQDVSIPYFDLFLEVMKVLKEKGCGDCTKAEKSFKERLLERKAKEL
ncbi:MAG: hypothetical protein WC119_02365 [Synergistaceae bacterium]